MGCFRTKSSKVSEQLPFLSDIYEMTSAAQGRRKVCKSRGRGGDSNPTYFEEKVLFLFLPKSGGAAPLFPTPLLQTQLCFGQQHLLPMAILGYPI